MQCVYNFPCTKCTLCVSAFYVSALHTQRALRAREIVNALHAMYDILSVVSLEGEGNVGLSHLFDIITCIEATQPIFPSPNYF